MKVTTTLFSMALLGLLSAPAMARKPFGGKSTNMLTKDRSREEKIAAFLKQAAVLKNAETKFVGKTAKTTALQSRVIANAYRQFNGITMELADSVQLSYTGDRGGDLNSGVIKYDTLKFFTVLSGTVDKSGLQTQTFDVKNNIAVNKSFDWNGSAFDNSEQHFYSYTADNKVAVDSVQKWNGTAWENSNKELSSYTASREISEKITQQWTGTAWENADKTIYTYTTGGKISETKLQFWTGASWFTFVQITYDNDAVSGNLLSSLLQIDLTGAGVLVNNSRSLYTYDAGKRQIAQDNQQWDEDDAAWYNDSSYLNKYDAFDNKTERIAGYKGDLSGMLTDTFARNSYTYNGYKQMLTDISDTWDDVAHGWIKSSDDYDDRYYYEEYSGASVKETIPMASVKLYPVPANDILHLSLQPQQLQSFTLSLVDMQGRILQLRTIPATAQINETINVSALPAGNYLLQLNGGNSAPIVKQITIAH